MQMRKLAVAIASIGFACGVNASVIDLFDINQGYYTDDTANSSDTGVVIGSGVGGSVNGPATSILGGNRDLYVSLLESPDPTNVNASIGVSGSVLNFSVESRAEARGQIQWDGTEATEAINYTGLSGYDLTEGGTLNTVALDILFNDRPFAFDITLFTDSVNFTRISFVANQHLIAATTYIPLIAFSNDALCGAVNPAPGVTKIECGGTGGEITNAGAIVVDLDRFGGTTSIDLTIDNISRIPEPGVLALIGAGLLGVWGAGRRKTS